MSATATPPTTYEGSRIPSRVPTVLDVPDELRDSEDVMQAMLVAHPDERATGIVDGYRSRVRRESHSLG